MADKLTLRQELDTLLIRVGKTYDSASHPAYLITAHRDQILSLIKSRLKPLTGKEIESIYPISEAIPARFEDFEELIKSISQSTIQKVIEELER